MNVPLSVEAIEKNRKEYLSIWYNREKKDIESPIKPYFYSLERLNVPGKESTVKAIAISDFREKTFYKYEFDTRAELVKHRIEGKTFEDNIPFILRNRIDNPDIYTNYAHTNPLKFNFFDIEQDCAPNKLFPTFDDQMLSISFAGNDRKIRAIYLKDSKTTDKKLLEKYREHYPFPDVEVLYNKMYDFPVLFERCKAHQLETNWFAKDFTNPYIGGKSGVRINGTVIYDILDSTRRDQSLTGNVPNKGLKVVSDYFGFKSQAKVLVGDEISKASKEELVAYNKEDVARLFHLFDIYWKGIEYTANDLKIPLNLAVDINITDLGIVVLGDLYREHNIICDGDNATRYPEIFKRKKKFGEGNFQGALVFIKRRGLFTPILKADYSSMYPTIVAEFNLSPDTCKLIRYDKYQKGGFKIEEDDKSFTYHIPDVALKKNVVVQTLKGKEGFLSKAVHRFLDERSKFKNEWKKTGSKVARARSDIAKVKANGGVYGNQGNPHHPFGFAPIAVATTGIGRECAKLLIDILEKLYPNSVVEVDTDGVYFTAEDYNEERIIHYFNEALEKKFKKKLNLSIDIDVYDCGFFHKAKNYILKKKDNIILHGAAMKASSKDKLSKNLINDIARAKLENKSTEPIVLHYKNDLKSFPLSDFAMQVTMGMHLHQYKSTSCLSVQMAMKGQQHFGIRPKLGNNYHYVKCTYGYELFQLAKKDNLDYRYYANKIDKIIKMLESEYELFSKIGDFLDDEENSWEVEMKGVKVKENQPQNLEGFL